MGLCDINPTKRMPVGAAGNRLELTRTGSELRQSREDLCHREGRNLTQSSRLYRNVSVADVF